jgi:hypothetical protein
MRRATQRKGDIAVARAIASFTAAGLRNIHSNSQGYVVKFIDAEVYDWLYVLHADGREFLVKHCPLGRRAMSVVKMKSLETGLASYHHGGVPEWLNGLLLKSSEP